MCHFYSNQRRILFNSRCQLRGALDKKRLKQSELKSNTQPKSIKKAKRFIENCLQRSLPFLSVVKDKVHWEYELKLADLCSIYTSTFLFPYKKRQAVIASPLKPAMSRNRPRPRFRLLKRPGFSKKSKYSKSRWLVARRKSFTPHKQKRFAKRVLEDVL